MDAKAEAMTLIIWGRPQKEVVGFLMDKGHTPEEALTLVNDMLEKRYRLVRERAISMLIIGSLVGAMCLGCFIYVLSSGNLSLWLSWRIKGLWPGLMVVGSAWGIWRVISACFNLARPERVRGDLGHHEESF